MLPREWAESQGIALIAGADAREGDFRVDPRIDFGRLQRRVPGFVLAPRSIDQLAECLRHLAETHVPYKLRGAAHSPSGEVLSDGGAVVALEGLRGVVADDPEHDEITVLTGTTWLALWEHLAAQGRRPLTLTDNTRVTLAGTLAIGGVGDASHVHGPQAAGARRIVLVTPDGARHELAPGDPHFAHALCGHGQLGAIAQVTFATARKPSMLTGRVMRWGSLDPFLEDAGEIVARGLYDYVRGRVVWAEGLVRAWAILAYAGEPGPELGERNVMGASKVETLDLLAHARVDPVERWPAYNPCAEIVLPYPAGIAALRRIDTALARGPLIAHLPRGSSLQLVRGTQGLALSPFPFETNIVLALRPEFSTLADALACEPALRAIVDETFAAGGRAYLTSFPLGRDQLAAQLGDGARTLAALKTSVDPGALCNRGNLFGWEAA